MRHQNFSTFALFLPHSRILVIYCRQKKVTPVSVSLRFNKCEKPKGKHSEKDILFRINIKYFLINSNLCLLFQERGRLSAHTWTHKHTHTSQNSCIKLFMAMMSLVKLQHKANESSKLIEAFKTKLVRADPPQQWLSTERLFLNLNSKWEGSSHLETWTLSFLLWLNLTFYLEVWQLV